MQLYGVAQPGINSIYSAYGIGDVTIRDKNTLAPMGSVGIAISSEKQVNTTNPASLSYIPRGTYIMELAATGSSINYKNENQSFKANDFVINGAALGFSISKKMGGAVSLKRYSNVEYYTTGNRYLEGTNSKLSEDITGNGGIYLATIGMARKFFHNNLSIGISGGSLFGSVNKKETIYTAISDGFIVENNSFYNNFYFNAGMQYSLKKAGYKWTLGATLQPDIKLYRTDDYYIKDFSDNIVYQDNAKKSRFTYPLQWGVGLTAARNNTMFSADYISQNWANTNYSGSSFRATDLQNLAVGFKHTFTRKFYNRTVDGISLMMGAQTEKSYIIINNYPVKSFSGSAGITIPSKQGLYNYTIGITYGQRGKIDYPLVKENFVECNLAISLGNFLNIGGTKYY